MGMMMTMLGFKVKNKQKGPFFKTRVLLKYKKLQVTFEKNKLTTTKCL